MTEATTSSDSKAADKDVAAEFVILAGLYQKIDDIEVREALLALLAAIGRTATVIPILKT